MNIGMVPLKVLRPMYGRQEQDGKFGLRFLSGCAALYFQGPIRKG